MTRLQNHTKNRRKQSDDVKLTGFNDTLSQFLNQQYVKHVSNVADEIDMFDGLLPSKPKHHLSESRIEEAYRQTD